MVGWKHIGSQATFIYLFIYFNKNSLSSNHHDGPTPLWGEATPKWMFSSRHHPLREREAQNAFLNSLEDSLIISSTQMEGRKTLSSPPTTGTTKSQFREQPSMKKTTTYHKRSIKTEGTTRWVGGVESQYSQVSSYPWLGNPQMQNNYNCRVSLKEEIWTRHCAPQPWVPAPEDEPPEHLALKGSRAGGTRNS